MNENNQEFRLYRLTGPAPSTKWVNHGRKPIDKVYAATSEAARDKLFTQGREEGIYALIRGSSESRLFNDAEGVMWIIDFKRAEETPPPKTPHIRNGL